MAYYKMTRVNTLVSLTWENCKMRSEKYQKYSSYFNNFQIWCASAAYVNTTYSTCGEFEYIARVNWSSSCARSSLNGLLRSSKKFSFCSIFNNSQINCYQFSTSYFLIIFHSLALTNKIISHFVIHNYFIIKY